MTSSMEENDKSHCSESKHVCEQKQDKIDVVDLQNSGLALLTEETASMDEEDTSENVTEVDDNDEDGPCRPSYFNKKIMIGLVLLGLVIFVIVDWLNDGYVRSGIQSFLSWIEHNPISGFFLFIIVFVVATVLLVPASILTLGAGFIFADAFGLVVGIAMGTLAVVVGAAVGAVLSFLVARYLLRDWVKGLAKKYALFEALETALSEKGFRIMALLRLSPVIPFNIVNYLVGVSSVSFRDYFLSMIAIIPGTILFVFLGASSCFMTESNMMSPQSPPGSDSSSPNNNNTITLIVMVVGGVLGVVAIVLTSFYAKKELNRVVAARAEMISTEDGPTINSNDEEVQQYEESSADLDFGSDALSHSV